MVQAVNAPAHTGATLDRLTHRCQITETKGESYRLAGAKGSGRRAPPASVGPCPLACQPARTCAARRLEIRPSRRPAAACAGR